MNHVPEMLLAIAVVLFVVFLALHRTSSTPPMIEAVVISAEPPRAISAPLVSSHSTSLSAFPDAGVVRGNN